MKKTSEHAKMSNEQVLFILDKYTTLAPYSHEFVEGGADPQILSGFVSAMTNFIEEMTGSEQIHWKTVYGSGSSFLVEGGEWTYGVLSAQRETSEIRSKLRRVVVEFEDSFSALKGADAIEGGAFIDFDKFVRRVFLEDRITENSIILKGTDWRELQTKYETPKQAFDVTKFLLFAESGKSIEEIAKYQRILEIEACSLARDAMWKNAIYVKYVPSLDDIIALSEGSASILLKPENPMNLSVNTLIVITSLNGRQPLSAVTHQYDRNDLENILSELGDLINHGYIHKISIEHRLALVNECILSELAQTCNTAVGTEEAKNYIRRAQKKGIVHHPWVGRIRINDDLSIYSALDTSMTPQDLDFLYDAVQYLIAEITHEVSKDIGNEYAEETRTSIIERCHKKWERYLQDGIL
ncbi:MAG: hypothetical protein ACTSUB_05465 [Candidatus Thorarchaeota archaeon]